MDDFETFFEKVKNPLRKQEISKTHPNRSELVKRFLDTKEKNLGSFKQKDPERAARYIQKLGDLKKKSMFRHTLKGDEFTLMYSMEGIDFYFRVDDPSLHTPSKHRIKASLNRVVPEFLQRIKGILPMRKPRFVIGEIVDEIASAGGVPPAYYQDRIIYIDDYRIDNADNFVHEYAHFIADLIPKQTEPLLIAEYDRMLDNYFKKLKKKTPNNLEQTPEKSNLKQRQLIAKKLGFPSEYGLSNFDEFFAEIITHWKKMPNNVNTYRFKQAVKKVITRL